MNFASDGVRIGTQITGSTEPKCSSTKAKLNLPSTVLTLTPKSRPIAQCICRLHVNCN